MNTKKEKELPVAASADAITHLRAVDAAGNSVGATPAQLAELNVIPTRNYVADGATENTAYTWYSTTASSNNANPIGVMAEHLKIGDWVCMQADVKTDGELRYQIGLGAGEDIVLNDTNGKFVHIFTTKQIKTQAELNSFTIPYGQAGSVQFSLYPASGTTVIKNRFIGIGNQPVDWFPAYGIDYSSLEEQVVPGEFFIGGDGVPKQVYRRTISAQGIFAPWGDNQAMFSSHTPLSNVDCVISVSGYTVVADAEGSSKSLLTKYTELVLFTYNAGGGFYEANRVKIVCIVDGRSVGQTVKICATIKYIKL